jgi:hypothetical protein
MGCNRFNSGCYLRDIYISEGFSKQFVSSLNQRLNINLINRRDIETLFIAMANAFGTFLIIIGLGYGSVNIPYRLFRFRDLHKR